MFITRLTNLYHKKTKSSTRRCPSNCCAFPNLPYFNTTHPLVGITVYTFVKRSLQLLFCRTKLRITVPGKQRFFRFIPINLLYIANIQVVIAHFVIFFQVTNNRNTAVSRNNGVPIPTSFCFQEGTNEVLPMNHLRSVVKIFSYFARF